MKRVCWQMRGNVTIGDIEWRTRVHGEMVEASASQRVRIRVDGYWQMFANVAHATTPNPMLSIRLVKQKLKYRLSMLGLDGDVNPEAEELQ